MKCAGDQRNVLDREQEDRPASPVQERGSLTSWLPNWSIFCCRNRRANNPETLPLRLFQGENNISYSEGASLNSTDEAREVTDKKGGKNRSCCIVM